jgi:hypothetical protein
MRLPNGLHSLIILLVRDTFSRAVRRPAETMVSLRTETQGGISSGTTEDPSTDPMIEDF